MAVKKNIVWFEEVGKEDVGLVGGKGANLGEMTTASFPIPYGFVVTAEAYFTFIKEANLEKQIKELLSVINYDNSHELQQGSKQIKDLILKSKMSEKLAREILKFYHELSAKEEQYLKKELSSSRKAVHSLKSAYKLPLVAVRSSATAEDLPDASFAGQQETFLNIQGESHLLLYVKECWASLFTERAMYYRHNHGYDKIKVGLAVVVQHMIESEKSGIAFSIDPVNNDKNKIVIEAIKGLGEYIVQGKVTPDHYEVEKGSLTISVKEIKKQHIKFVKKGRGNVEVKLNKKEGDGQKISDEEILKLAIFVKDIEKHYYFPQDIEWAIANDTVFIVQSRPITTIKKNEEAGKKTKDEKSATATQNQLLFSGAPASPGIGVGPVSIIMSPKEIDKIKKGDVMVAPQTNPDYVPAMKKAAAIVTERGGRTSHAAIVSRELGIPAVVGAEGAIKKLKNNQVVSVNGETGDVFKGAIIKNKTQNFTSVSERSHHRRLKTITKVYVNLAEPERAAEVAKLDSDGVGLLRAEFMIAEIGTHPKLFIKRKKQQDFIMKLTHNLLSFVKPFNPRPVIYRATDFKTNEYAHLTGGKEFEPHEENPMLGFRGAYRYTVDSDVFMMELRAIRNIWERGYRNLHLMIPFVRRPWELIKIKDLVKKSGLFLFKDFELKIMVEVPSSALELKEFIKLGIDGVSVGTNDLTMMLLGVDRDNEHVADLYDERSTAVTEVLEYIVKTCVLYNVPCSICGQAASDYPDMVEGLVKLGITSVSVNPDAVERTRELIYNIEKKHFNSIKRSSNDQKFFIEQ